MPATEVAPLQFGWFVPGNDHCSKSEAVMDYRDLDVCGTSTAMRVDLYKTLTDYHDWGGESQIIRRDLLVPSNIAEAEIQIPIGREIGYITDVKSTQWLKVRSG
jgi:hypothetical protein